MSAMFGQPAPDTRPDPDGLPNSAPDGTILGGIAKWSNLPSARRPTCDWCVLAIYQGKMRTHPNRATRKRIGPNETVYLCHDHGARQEARDKAAREEHDRRIGGGR